MARVGEKVFFSFKQKICNVTLAGKRATLLNYVYEINLFNNIKILCNL